MKTTRILGLAFAAIVVGSWATAQFLGPGYFSKSLDETVRQPSSVLDTKAEWNRFTEAVRVRKIDATSPQALMDLCKEGFTGACADAGRRLLMQCHELSDRAETEADVNLRAEGQRASEATCARANTLLLKGCADGFLIACDAPFQTVEGIGLREPIARIVEGFCSDKVPESCLTFEVILRNELDMQRDKPIVDQERWSSRRALYISLSDQNCNEGHYFSCLSLLDEDPSTSEVKRIQRAEVRLKAICDRAQDRFEKENCLWFADYLASTQRAPEGLRYADAACALESESGCFEAARIDFSSDKGGAHGIAQLQRSCALNAGTEASEAPAPAYCTALANFTKQKRSSWKDLSNQVAFSDGERDVTFETLMKLPVRQTY